MIKSTVCFHYHYYANTICNGVTWFMMIISMHNIWFYVLFFLGVPHASFPSCNAHFSLRLLGGYHLLVFGGFLGIFWFSQHGLVSIHLTLALTQPSISFHLWTWEFPLPFSFVDLVSYIYLDETTLGIACRERMHKREFFWGCIYPKLSFIYLHI